MNTTDPVLSDTARATLTELAAVDERIRLLIARLDALPETAEVERLEAEAEEQRRKALSTRRIAHDMSGTVHRLQADAARLRARRRDDIAGLRAEVDRERRRDLRHDLEVAERRLGEVEKDIAREERTLATFSRSADAGRDGGRDGGRDTGTAAEATAGGGDDAAPDSALGRARQEQAAVTGELHRQLGELRERSVALRAELPGDILTRYEEGERDQGVGAAELAGTTCRCCCISLDAATLRRFANTAPDRLVSCPECGVLLLRPEA